jgi:hypothetical protein
LKEISRLNNLKGGFFVAEFRVCAKKVFDPPRRQGEDSESLGFVELYIPNWQRHSKFRVRSGNNCVEVLKNLFNSDGEGQVAADQLQRMVLSN